MSLIPFAQVNAGPARIGLEKVQCVKADESNQQKRHNDLTVFPDLFAKRVLSATPEKAAPVLAAFVEE